MIILGMDQGLANFGYAVMKIEGKQRTLVHYGCFKSKANGNQQKRIFDLMTAVEELITKYKPDLITHERLFFSTPGKQSRNKSASILNTNMITGAIWYIAGKYNIPVHEYSPQTIKKITVGNGRAEKEVMIQKIESEFTIECPKTCKEHICDAVAIALAGSQNDIAAA